MTEWWTYRPSDFVMVSPRSYWRLVEVHNAEAWPWQAAALGLGLLALAALLRQHHRWPALLLALAWAMVAWFFHLQRYATIHTAAPAFALAFAAQAGMLLAGAAVRPAAAAPRLAWVLMALALAYPAVGLLAGRPWTQAELPGLLPDPTALFTLGWLLAARPGPAAPRWQRAAHAAAWPVPLLWCWGSGLTLWNLQALDAWVLPLAALLAVGAALQARLVR